MLYQKKGQATVEYILLMVAVIVVATVFKSFTNGFRKYGQGVADQYGGCLLETAVLPDLYSDLEQCNPPTFTLEEGSDTFPAYNSGKYDPGTYTPGTYNDSGPGSDGSSNNPFAGYAENRGQLGAGGGSGAAGGSGRNSSFAAGGGGGRSSNSAANRAGSQMFQANAFADGLNSQDQKSRRRLLRSKKIPVKKRGSDLTSGSGFSTGGDGGSSDDGFYSSAQITRSQEEAPQERKTTFAATTSSKKSSEVFSAKRESFVMEKKKQQTIKQAEEKPMTFNLYFKYLLIAALIAGLVFFLFSQFMQVRDNLKTV